MCHGKEAFKDFELNKAIRNHSEKFNTIKGIHYSNHQPDNLIIFSPKVIIKKWKEDYKLMQASVIYGKSKTFSGLISRKRAPNGRFKEIILD